MLRLLRSRERTENAYIEPWPCVVQGMHTLDFSYKLRDTPPALGAEQQPACITPAWYLHWTFCTRSEEVRTLNHSPSDWAEG